MVLLVIIGEAVVDFIGEDEDVVLLSDGSELFELGEGENFSNRVTVNARNDGRKG